jgi:hypothetical protein
MQGLVRLQVLPTGGGKSKGTVRGYGDAAAAKDRGGMGLDWVQLELELALALDFTLHMMVLRGLGRRIRSDPCVARGQRSAFFAALPRDGCRVVTLSIIVMAKAPWVHGDYESPYGSRLDAGLAVMAVLAGALCVAGQPSTSLPKRVTLPTSLLFDLLDQPNQPMHVIKAPRSRALIAGQHVGRSQLPRGLALLF